MKVEKTNLRNVLVITPDIFEDHRGEYCKTYDELEYNRLFMKNGINEILTFIEDDISIATKHVIKGLHGDDKTWKLISCPYGKFYLMVVNYDKSSDDYGKWQSFTLSDKNRKQVLVPPKHANGHLCMSQMSIFAYKQTEYYNIYNQFSVKWNDKELDMWWPISNPILSRRDQEGDAIYVEK